MVENQDIHGAITAIMKSMRLQGTSPGRLKNFQNAYNVFERYLSDNSISKIDENICLEYVYAKTGQRFERFECVTSSARVDYRMRPLLLLLRYLQDGQFHSDVRKTKPSFVCPACFKSEYEAFCEELFYRGYSKATIESNTKKVQFLIMFMVTQGITSSSAITIRHIDYYLKTLENKSVKYVGLFSVLTHELKKGQLRRPRISLGGGVRSFLIPKGIPQTLNTALSNTQHDLN